MRTNKYGEQAEFRGQFEAINLANGELSKAGRMYLPSEPSNELETSLKADKENKGVKFAYELSITTDDSERGYFYSMESLLEPVQSDVLSELRKVSSTDKKEPGRPAPKK
jgi:hypothetical protein